ncbi:RNA-splicing factor [Boothiomyces macroporosus]|uniref:RNA-splicing factor n=1 Tax=Boothiomyces macroporosus TaxID=261099 RepID=A0AAD5UFJ5_9FUNG|nr:RNA-splicing factor [Boothiomyces macroporosus]KAJ3256532.1 RNA-splicing factor [Boothiomyces macroporosus]
MGGGDLNLKKSWHPNTYKNQEIVWKREQEVEKEKRKLEQLRKEIQEERDRDELLGLHDTSKGRQKNIRLEWMYASGPSQQNDYVDQEKEAFLLGKKRIDKVDQPTTTHVTDKPVGNSVYGLLANTQRDFQNKVRDDPLLEFRRQEQLTLEAMLKNPLRLKELQKRKEKEERKRLKKEKKKSKHDSPDERSDRKRDRSYTPERRRDRSYSPERKRDRSYTPERRDRSRTPERKRRDRSRSPYQKRSRERESSRSRRSTSPERRQRKRDYSPHRSRELTVK